MMTGGKEVRECLIASALKHVQQGNLLRGSLASYLSSSAVSDDVENRLTGRQALQTGDRL